MEFRSDRMRELLRRVDPRKGAQNRLARRLGVSRQVVSDWMLGNKRPGGQLLVDLACYLGTTADDLLPPSLRPDRPASGE